MQVVREQITRALAMKPSSTDQLKNKLRGLNYSEILRLRQSERMSQDDFQSPPIMLVGFHSFIWLMNSFISILVFYIMSLIVLLTHRVFFTNWTQSQLCLVLTTANTVLLNSFCFCCSELRERIQPEILELIKQQRLNRLCEGSCFRKLGNRRRQGI